MRLLFLRQRKFRKRFEFFSNYACIIMKKKRRFLESERKKLPQAARIDVDNKTKKRDEEFFLPLQSSSFRFDRLRRIHRLRTNY
mmetsp:Transcript_6817/g.20398  ORF Transcript_6817/g.20398 Transcript_6817/m.20398 type:complete len:84 (+) Transcript_6817:2465-2716(+)